MRGLELVEHNVKRISHIIRALLGFAGHNAQETEWEEFDVGRALRQALALVEHRFDKGLIETSLVCADDLPMLVGNIGELEQVFINLMINAQNAMADGGTFMIEVQCQGQEVEVRFADTGPGIAPEHFDRIFEPFYTTRPDGTGLGLYISKAIVVRHGGTLRLTNHSEGGAIVTVLLPIAIPESATKEAPEADIGADLPENPSV